jgi:UDP-3-O-[3-hydroxymyristoyl] glucosamine N-acyltransferase
MGDHVILQNGAVIGSDGFGFARHARSRTSTAPGYKIVQSGPAVLEDHVEIQANSCIDRASVGETRIGARRQDRQSRPGRPRLENRRRYSALRPGRPRRLHHRRQECAFFAGQAASSGHLKVGNGVIVTAQSGLPGDVEPGSIRSGSPAIDNRLWLKVTAALNRLPELQKRVNQLERELDLLKTGARRALSSDE